QQSLSALEAGSHIICEKPVATDSATAGHVLERAEELGLGGTVPFVYRYHPMVREARARIRRGDTGALLTVDASYLQDWLLDPDDENWRVDAGSGGPSRAFADIGSTSSISSNSSPGRPSPPWRRRCARSILGAGECR